MLEVHFIIRFLYIIIFSDLFFFHPTFFREHATVKIREGEHIIHCMGHKCPSEFNDSRILQQILEPKTYEVFFFFFFFFFFRFSFF